MNTVVVSNISKRYQINSERKTTFTKSSIKDDLVKLWEKPLRMFTGPIKQMKTNVASKKKIEFWALKDIDFSLTSGDVLGIIGSNGSGKSTLLKILAGITTPTQGEARLLGRVASLLAVGVGFHSDLSGRDNIFLAGALLGFKKKAIEKEFARIVEFSEIGKFIDTPVKYYSSGMYVRLAFSIATSDCMIPDIFLIDEVLSVGDTRFQNKCIKRIQNLIAKNNTTVIVVNHNLKIIKKLSNICLLLDKGKVHSIGEPKQIIQNYKTLLKNTKGK